MSRSSNKSAPHSINNSVPSSSSVSDAGCAVNANGTLKDASKIEFFFNKDDNLPMAIASRSASEGSVTEASKSKGNAPATKLCASTCKSKPSQCVLEAKESEPPKKSSVVIDTDSGNESDSEQDTEKDLSGPDNSDLTYEKLKEMGDNDNAVQG
ncbi:hypothetical protein BDQ17DRAFT_1429026 [Cyathus striatus]|nr:hypothetical protein BDQ17DRAFT_1429026 [Cyathus striatus]